MEGGEFLVFNFLHISKKISSFFIFPILFSTSIVGSVDRPVNNVYDLPNGHKDSNMHK